MEPGAPLVRKVFEECDDDFGNVCGGGFPEEFVKDICDDDSEMRILDEGGSKAGPEGGLEEGLGGSSDEGVREDVMEEVGSDSEQGVKN